MLIFLATLVSLCHSVVVQSSWLSDSRDDEFSSALLRELFLSLAFFIYDIAEAYYNAAIYLTVFTSSTSGSLITSVAVSSTTSSASRVAMRVGLDRFSSLSFPYPNFGFLLINFPQWYFRYNLIDTMVMTEVLRFFMIIVEWNTEIPIIFR